MQIFNIREYKTQVGKRLKTWKEENFAHRLWERDPLLWFSEPVTEITDRLGWLDLPEIMQEKLDDMTSFAEQVKTEGIRHVVLLGIGGSSLAPDVFQHQDNHVQFAGHRLENKRFPTADGSADRCTGQGVGPG